MERGGIVGDLPVREKLARLLALARGRKRLIVFSHDNPDPDSLASAAGLVHLLQTRLGIPGRVAYGGIIGRAENAAMVRVLRLQVVPVSRVDFEDEDLIALVDTQPSVGNHSVPARYRPDIVIDHHPPREESALSGFADVGGDYGATSTMLVEYLRAAGVEPTPEIATALFYGIKADTRDLGRQTTARDVESYSYLLPLMNKKALAEIEHPALPASYFRLYHQAYERARVHHNAITVDLGEVYTPDMVAEIAERMIALDGMKWSLAYGSYGDQLFLSIRCNDRRMNAGRLIREICEDLGGSSGGHGSMAGARLPFTGSASQREKLKRSLLRRFLVEFGVGDSKGTPLLEHDHLD